MCRVEALSAEMSLSSDLLDDRQIVVAGRRADVASSGGVIASAEHEHAEVRLAPLERKRYSVRPAAWPS